VAAPAFKRAPFPWLFLFFVALGIALRALESMLGQVETIAFGIAAAEFGIGTVRRTLLQLLDFRVEVGDLA
jgi:hypothetical protein